jgi:hypothetical protein
VAKMARSATAARSVRRPKSSGIVRINFSRPQMSTANEANPFCTVGQDIFVVLVVGAANDNARPRIDPLSWVSIFDLSESMARSTIAETLLSRLFRRAYRSNYTPKLILWLGLTPNTPIA